LILAAPAVWGDDTFSPVYRFALWMGAHTVPWLNVSGGHLDIQVTDNIKVLRKLSRDPLMIHEARLDTLYGLVGLMDRALKASARIRLPALVQYGLHDEVVPRRSVCSMLARMNDRPAVAFYPHGYHLLMRDLHAEQVWKDMAAWIHSRAVTSTGGTVTAVCGSQDTGAAAHAAAP
ncbi:MAG TPA: alpha/beta hydrolase, partial [Pseudodesulfovibrio sp.]|nr:alpha/beta hydrolase [Pseudodesulfovibrio sp.]